MKQQRLCFLLLILFFSTISTVTAQPELQKDFSYVMEIPSVIAMESSPAHLYVLSGTEGMVVFRAQSDTLQWLYSSTGMELRGNTITADIRFAYQFGSNRRLTVLEPTSVLGVYSAALLPAQPLDAERMNSFLYTALGSRGLGRLSLATPSSVDSTVALIEKNRFGNENVIDLEASLSQLFVLVSDEKLFVFKKTKESIEFSKELNLRNKLEHIFIIGEALLGTDNSGTIYEIDASGNLAQLGSIGEPVKKIESWKNWLIIKGSSNRLWTSWQNRSPVLWKDDGEADNYFTVTKNQFWLCEYNQISRIITSDRPEAVTFQPKKKPTGKLSLKPLKDRIVPFPRPVLASIELANNYPVDQVRFAYQSRIQDAKIKGSGFYWQPQANDVGSHTFKIIANSSDGQADSTSFRVDVRSFNAPPRFSPIRPVTIPVGEPFILPVKATDPDGMDPDLVRYLGVDLPEGSRIDEHTGDVRWTPSARQMGENKFQVIATDQYGAASQVDIIIRVIEVSRDGTGGIEGLKD